jgi:sugar/nucleoside kinase (ribokinase family)
LSIGLGSGYNRVEFFESEGVVMNGYTVFIGDVALDEYYVSDHWPKLKEKISVQMLKPEFGGMIANAACVFAALGGNTRFCGVLNSGSLSKILLENLNAYNVNTDLVVFDDSLPDSKTIIILAEGEHTVFIPDMHIESIDLTQEHFDILCGAEFVYTTITELRRLKYHNMSCDCIVDNLHENGVKIFCDLDVGYLDEEKEEYYKKLDIAIFNEIGFSKYRKNRNEERAIFDLLSYGIEIVVVTLAEKGCNIYTKDRSSRFSALQVQQTDVTGAGDTFCAAFLFAYQKYRNVDMAVNFAVTAAAICVEGQGARSGAVGEKVVMDRMKM